MHVSPTKATGDEAERLLEEVRDLLGELHVSSGRPVRIDSDLVREVGLDSLSIVELFDRVERAFSVRLPEEVLATATTPADWLRAVFLARERSGKTCPVTPSEAPRAAGAPSPEATTTLTEALFWHAERHPALVSVRLLVEGTVEELTYGGLAAAAADLAGALRSRGLGQGERVAIMLPTGADYFAVFLGVLVAGCVPVPIYPPARREVIEEHLRRQSRLLDNAGAVLLVTVPEAMVAARLLRTQVPSLRRVETRASLVAASAARQPFGTSSPSDLALVQYTSGSTGDPKGVMLTHAQLLANIRAMGAAAQVSSADVFVSWLPLYHDMGLIGAFLAPLYFGFPLVVSSPLRFLARPESWLESISVYRGTISAAPNFAYRSCVDRIDDAELTRLDLSSWRIAFNGSEPVSALSIERFVERFGPCGFSATAMCPAYGLAEVGVGISFSSLGRGPRVDIIDRAELRRAGRAMVTTADRDVARRVVSAGMPLPGYEVAVRDASGEELPDRHEGEVFVRGPSATAGYFANARANAHLWQAGFLDTGDLGYVADGELYLTGRAKDLVIRAGRNLHPEELEQVLGELDGVEREGVAAFASADPHLSTERLVIVLETETSSEAARARIRDAVLQATVDLLGSPPDEVVLVRKGILRRTPSGKLRRGATRDAFEAGTLEETPGPVALQLVRFAASGIQPMGRRVVAEAKTRCFAVYVWALAVFIAALTGLAVALPFSVQRRWRLVRMAGDALRRATGIGLSIEGSSPHEETCVVVANHESFVDGLALILAFRDPVVVVTSTELRSVPFVGAFLERIGCVFVERGRAERSEETLEQLVAVVRDGRRLVVFPEGSITRAPGLRLFHLGAFAVAAKAGCPIVPVGVRGSRDVVRPGTYLPRRASIALSFGAPIAPGGTDFAAQIALRDAARDAISTLSREPLV